MEFERFAALHADALLRSAYLSIVSSGGNTTPPDEGSEYSHSLWDAQAPALPE